MSLIWTHEVSISKYLISFGTSFPRINSHITVDERRTIMNSLHRLPLSYFNILISSSCRIFFQKKKINFYPSCAPHIDLLDVSSKSSFSIKIQRNTLPVKITKEISELHNAEERMKKKKSLHTKALTFLYNFFLFSFLEKSATRSKIK